MFRIPETPHGWRVLIALVTIIALGFWFAHTISDPYYGGCGLC